jgi:lantibiotic modifying enzyme
MTWCHGAPGIALCRVAAATAGIEELSVSALAATQAFDIDQAIDLPELGLCHGAMGVIDAHLSAMSAGLIPVTDLCPAVSDILARLDAFPSAHTFMPGLMTGLAGVGSALLRIKEPSFPDVLTLDPPAQASPPAYS